MDRRLFGWITPIVFIFGIAGCNNVNFVGSNVNSSIQQPTVPNRLYGAEPQSPNIRLLCIKHSREHMADGDANLAIKATQKASEKGLNIKVVGNHFVDGRYMGLQNADPETIERIYSIETLSQYLNQYIKTEATPGDTLILFTIGHGFRDGSLDNMGHRSDVLKVIADIAEKNNQKIFWWQLSCYASAGLPDIGSLSPRQQELITIFATSSASETSAAYVQGNIMAKIFNAMAEKSSAIDPNGDGKITAKELRVFMNTINGSYGSRVHAKSGDFTMFGKSGVPLLPIVDRNNPQGKYPEDYVFPPR